MIGPNDREENNNENRADSENVDNRDSVTEFEESLEAALRDGIDEDMNSQGDQ